MNRIENFTLEGTVLKFEYEDGAIAKYPASAVIFVDDESGVTSVKLVASRCTIGLIKND